MSLLVRKGDTVAGNKIFNFINVAAGSTGAHAFVAMAGTATKSSLFYVPAGDTIEDALLVAQKGLSIGSSTLNSFGRVFVTSTDGLVFEAKLANNSKAICRWSASASARRSRLNGWRTRPASESLFCCFWAHP